MDLAQKMAQKNSLILWTLFIDQETNHKNKVSGYHQTVI